MVGAAFDRGRVVSAAPAPALELDHFVIHIDDDPNILSDLKARLAVVNVPFEPDWGKGTKGFKAGNIWIGRQYFEIIRILRPDGGGWVDRWVARYHAGQRGLYCVFFKTDNLDGLAARLHAAGIQTPACERVTYRVFFGLFRKTMPWRMLYLPPLPGTDLELAFIEYDPDPRDVMKAHMVPNADENGITGIDTMRLRLPFGDEARDFLLRIFPHATGSADALTVPLAKGALRIDNAVDTHADLHAKRADAGASLGAVTLENVTLHVEADYVEAHHAETQASR